MAFRLDDISINTVIGDGSSITGDVRINGFVRVDGDIDGNLETDGNVIVGARARVRGNITANAVTVSGIVLGNIFSKSSVKLLTTSAIIGDVLAHHVLIEENVIFHGHCISISDEEKFAEESEKYLQEQAIIKKAGRI